MSDWLHNSVNDPNLRNSITDLIQSYPPSERVLKRVVAYFDENRQDRSEKKRKLDKDELSNNVVFRIIGVSFQSIRKKLDLIVTRSDLILHNSKTHAIEYQKPLEDIVSGVCVPSPDRANKCYTFVLFPKNDDCIVFSVQDKGDITIKHNDTTDQILNTDKHLELIRLFADKGRIPITQPSTEAFRSTGKSTTKDTKSYVIAYLKAKDGYLFFLSTGILFGFKKPTLFFPIQSLGANVITNITQHTFDLTLTVKLNHTLLGCPSFKLSKEGEDDVIQFSMIEKSEYEGIHQYIKRVGINDQSMAEERKAPLVNKGQAETKPDSEDEEHDDDFEPSEDEDEPLEYDTDASHEEGNPDMETQHPEASSDELDSE
ncbi:hypothetical protein BDB01DRAFT_725746 [Pilobolus umbonatus]|nr:hypothetical protein BDB01DRAFT_725746 [Pilobolus umbonatus]